jgi:hypothetical protein
VAQSARLTARASFFLACALAACALAACTRKAAPPAAPAAPLPADPEIELESMQIECDAMLGALAAYKACPNHDEDDREAVEAWIDRADHNFAAGRKATPEPNAQKAIAAACRRATDSVKAAAERCQAGPRPRGD